MNVAGAAPRTGRPIHVHQGDYAVSASDSDMMTSVLGSCVATCLYDPHAGVGGMNHFLLPDAGSDTGRTRLYGVHLMELLINNLLRLGAERSNLKAKLFGGGKVIAGLSDIGARNAAFARQFLSDEDLPCMSESLGGEFGRRIRFWPSTGRVRLMTLTTTSEQIPRTAPTAAPDLSGTSGELELF
ncbi:MAG: chemotaxis protein CheD [Pseudomonadota bacterium]